MRVLAAVPLLRTGIMPLHGVRFMNGQDRSAPLCRGSALRGTASPSAADAAGRPESPPRDDRRQGSGHLCTGRRNTCRRAAKRPGSRGGLPMTDAYARGIYETSRKLNA